jgi:osmotically-inducible protein OsmY
MKTRFPRLPLAALTLAVAAGTLAGCAPLVVGGAAMGALMVTDRRTSGAQIDDETIELRSGARLREAFGDTAHVNVNSYNRQVLLTGEVPNAAARQRAEQIVGGVDNVKGIVNELVVMGTTTLAERSVDVLVTGKVRASFVDASDLQATAFRVVTERGTVYLMGRVTAGEADRATQIARQISGVNKVVRVFEIISVDEARRAGMIQPGAAPAPATVAPAVAPAPAPVAPALAPAPAPGGAVANPVR